MKPGDKVHVVLDNGYRTTGIIVRCFKNGGYGVREANGRYYTRRAKDVRPATDRFGRGIDVNGRTDNDKAMVEAFGCPDPDLP